MYAPVTFKLPVIVTSPVSPIAPVDPVNAIGVFVTPPSLTVKLKFLSCEVCATVTWFDETLIAVSYTHLTLPTKA